MLYLAKNKAELKSLRYRRLDLRIPLVDVATRLGVTKELLRSWEMLKADPPPEILAVWRKFLEEAKSAWVK